MKSIFRSCFLLMVAASLAAQVNAQQEDFSKLFGGPSKFLKVDEAFKPTIDIVDDEIVVSFDIADDYYMYRGRFHFSAEGAKLEDPQIPDGKKKTDEYLGDVEVYHHRVDIAIPYVASSSPFLFTYEYQGCAEEGLCYPPESREIELIPTTYQATSVAPQNSTISADRQSSGAEPPAISTDGEQILSTADQKDSETAEEFVPEQEKVVNLLTDKSLLEIIIYFLIIGIGLAFTPCVLPMVPILSSIIVGQGEKISTGKAFSLSLVYTQSVAIVYAILGIIIGSIGEAASNTFQEPIFVIPAAIIFVLLSLSMFGFYELQLPQGMQNKLNSVANSQQSGSFLGTAIMGLISALVVSPCVTVPLAGILIYIAQTGDTIIGGTALYSLGVGMGLPLLLVGVGGGTLLPKAGGWMNTVKAAFGVVMLGMALYITKHLIPVTLYMYAWALLLIVASIYMGALSTAATGAEKLWKGVGLAVLVYGILLIVGAASGGRSVLDPFAGSTHLKGAGMLSQTAANQDIHSRFKRIKTVADVDAVLAQAKAEGRPVMFDFFAESCTACYEFAEKTFPKPEVITALGDAILIQADVTANDKDDKTLMKHFDVRGLPSILFFNKKGVEQTRLRAIGFEEAETFAKRIKFAFKS